MKTLESASLPEDSIIVGLSRRQTCALWMASCSSSSRLRTRQGRLCTGLAVICTGSSKSWPIMSLGWQQNTCRENRREQVTGVGTQTGVHVRKLACPIGRSQLLTCVNITSVCGCLTVDPGSCCKNGWR